MKPTTVWQRAHVWSGGGELSNRQLQALGDYSAWLTEEAGRAGGLGPGEKERVELRHVADSLLFGLVMTDHPATVFDLGSGVGLPGIPLAIAHPHVGFVLLDRSGRRIDLIRRAVRILDLDNVTVNHLDLKRLPHPVEAVVSRAVLPLHRLQEIHTRLSPSGLAVIGGSWVTRPQTALAEVVSVPATILDHPVWLLKMRRP